MFEVSLVPASDDVPDLAAAVLTHGVTVLGRGWHSATDPQLSRKQLRIAVDLDEGTVVATRLGGNPSRVARVAEPPVPPHDLPKDAPVPVFHGDTLFLVGSKLAFSVRIRRLLDAAAATPIAATVPLDLDTLALVGLRASASAGRDGSAAASSIRRPSSGLKSDECASSHGLDRTRTTLSYEGASVSQDDLKGDNVGGRAAAEESRWTDDEDDNDTKRNNYGPSRGGKRRRVCRADFSDESEDYSIEGLLQVTSDTDSESVKDNTSAHIANVSLQRTSTLILTPTKSKLLRKSRTKAKRSPNSTDMASGDEATVLINESPCASSSVHNVKKETRRSRIQSDDRKQLIEELKESKSKRQRALRQKRENMAPDRKVNHDDEGSSVPKGMSLQAISKQNRRVTAYGLFAKEERRKMKTENPELEPSDITKAIKSKFNELDEKDLLKFTCRATQLNNKITSVDADRADENDVKGFDRMTATPPKQDVLAENLAVAQSEMQSDTDSGGSVEIVLGRRE
ncbi:hypothetical protein HDU84_005496 [Entophlyctis sp. JEL0112]|nr:hypothetical protein HDU84_005496 [Entophlyctis sp. JEL0112]